MEDDPAATPLVVGSRDGYGSSTSAARTEAAVKASELTGKLHPVAMFAITYFLVCGGAYGMEAMGNSIPPLYALLGILIVPLLWSFSMALMTAEMATALPYHDGFYGWIKDAWGDLASFLDGYVITLVVICDQALYPIIFMLYLDEIVSLSAVARYFVNLSFIIVCAAINLAGLNVFGTASQIFAMIVLLPIFVFVFVGLSSSKLQTGIWTSTAEPEGGSDWALWTSVLVWGTCGYEYTGFYSKDVKNPQRNLPLVMFAAVLAMTCTYLFPVAVALGVSGDQSVLEEGAYVLIAEMMEIGKWLPWALIIGGLISNLATFNTYLFTAAASLRSMAINGKAPPLFAWLPQFEAPVMGILFYSLTSSILILLDFDALVQIESVMYCFHIILFAVTMTRLRFVKPSIPRPFSVGKYGQWILPVAPVLVAGFNIAVSDRLYLVASIGFIGAGILIYAIMQYRRLHKSERYEAIADAITTPAPAPAGDGW